MTQVDIWRMQAFDRLETLLHKLPDGTDPNDILIDSLIRDLSKLPARPADKPPYMGIFSLSDTHLGRQKAAERLQELQDTLQGDLNPIDCQVDDLLRALSNLPKRPADKQPYASLFPATPMNLLTVGQLTAILPDADSTRVAALTPHINRTCIEFDITTPLRQAHFLAQVAHESDRLHALEEYASGEDYEWRDDLGNTQPGDGVRFKGRGLIQITGRANYSQCGAALNVDLIAAPKRLADPDLACRSAGWFWDTRQLNPDADKDDVETVTKVINGGYNGLDDRVQLLQAAKRILSA
ncbi:glycoside hydrolase family 19 protein [Leptolyngbya sp. FACHB-36]|uniref:glycoside hydrolase family 19 protein n=1 Tax=Leptolyngbya sp. FACHB-36 TaxID=2692808 RepID=UPI0018EF9486